MAPTVIYDAPGAVRATHDPATSEIVVTWTKFANDGHFRPSLDAQAALVAGGKARFIVVDTTTTTGTPTPEDQAYLVDKIFPQYKRGGLQAIVTIVPQSAITKMGAKRWQSSGAQFGFAMYEAASLRDAYALLAKEFPAERRAA